MPKTAKRKNQAFAWIRQRAKALRAEQPGKRMIDYARMAGKDYRAEHGLEQKKSVKTRPRGSKLKLKISQLKKQIIALKKKILKKKRTKKQVEKKAASIKKAAPKKKAVKKKKELKKQIESLKRQLSKKESLKKKIEIKAASVKKAPVATINTRPRRQRIAPTRYMF
jgi:predicted RNase H-like nuclease (RuvC/YqgF family)